MVDKKKKNKLILNLLVPHSPIFKNSKCRISTTTTKNAVSNKKKTKTKKKKTKKKQKKKRHGFILVGFMAYQPL